MFKTISNHEPYYFQSMSTENTMFLLLHINIFIELVRGLLNSNLRCPETLTP